MPVVRGWSVATVKPMHRCTWNHSLMWKLANGGAMSLKTLGCRDGACAGRRCMYLCMLN